MNCENVTDLSDIRANGDTACTHDNRDAWGFIHTYAEFCVLDEAVWADEARSGRILDIVRMYWNGSQLHLLSDIFDREASDSNQEVKNTEVLSAWETSDSMSSYLKSSLVSDAWGRTESNPRIAMSLTFPKITATSQEAAHSKAPRARNLGGKEKFLHIRVSCVMFVWICGVESLRR